MARLLWVASIINIDILEQIERKYQFTEKLAPVVNCRDHRMGLERVFAILLFRENMVTKENCSNFGSILAYPDSFTSNVDLKALKESYPGAILKTWHGR